MPAVSDAQQSVKVLFRIGRTSTATMWPLADNAACRPHPGPGPVFAVRYTHAVDFGQIEPGGGRQETTAHSTYPIYHLKTALTATAASHSVRLQLQRKDIWSG